MKNPLSLLAVIVLIALGFAAASGLTRSEPWQPAQLMEPSELADKINGPNTSKPLIISIGPAPTIKTSVGVGPGSEAENRAALARLVRNEPKTREIVLYCGCCPFAKCPNVRPAFTTLNERGFKNHRLLNLAKNLKTDWIDKGYPVVE
ncbi:MAG: rhodanese-like domain-containing protein [Bacteroidetes bacterium]|nr:rhodanese-like domain-containing protein [Fibrella sp.]